MPYHSDQEGVDVLCNCMQMSWTVRPYFSSLEIDNHVLQQKFPNVFISVTQKEISSSVSSLVCDPCPLLKQNYRLISNMIIFQVMMTSGMEYMLNCLKAIKRNISGWNKGHRRRSELIVYFHDTQNFKKALYFQNSLGSSLFKCRGPSSSLWLLSRYIGWLCSCRPAIETNLQAFQRIFCGQRVVHLPRDIDFPILGKGLGLSQRHCYAKCLHRRLLVEQQLQVTAILFSPG